MTKQAEITTRSTAGILAIALVVVLAGCGGGSSSSSTKASTANTNQPENSWTLVQWLKGRSDTDSGKGVAKERRWKFTPSCSEGKCDITVTVDGVNGTYLPEGYTPSDPSAVKPEPTTLTYNAATGTYDYSSPKTVTSCTTVDGTVVPDAYENTLTTSLKFTPAANGKPAAIHGTTKETAKGVGAGIAAKCTDYEATWTVAGAPTAAFSQPDSADVAGKFTVTEIVESTEPAGSRPPGFSGILIPTSTVEKSTSGYKVSGVTETPAEVSATPTGLNGSSTQSTTCTLSGGIPDGFTTTEKWSNLRRVAMSEDGKPVLVGGWQFNEVPTAAGTAANCTGSSNKGYVIFVPQSAI